VFHVILEKVPRHVDVLGLFTDQCVPGASDQAVGVLLDGGGCAGGLIEDLAHELSKVDALLGGVTCIVVLCSDVDWAMQVCCLEF
jgi:hypothetical protein